MSSVEQLASIPEIEKLTAGIGTNGDDQSQPESPDPIETILTDSGLGGLETGAQLAAIEGALRTLALNLTDSDDLRRATIREAALKKLGDIGISAPGKLIDAALQSSQSSASEPGLMLFTDPEPWPAVVDGGKLLDDIVSLLRRYLILPADAAPAIALWILHAWALDAFDISPLLAITSATKRCGKTTLLETVGMLVPRPLPASNITAAALFRAVEKFKPVMLIDEADTFFGEKDDLRDVINSGHRRSSAFVIRTVGDEHEPKTFSTWGAKAIAAIGKLSGTMEDRSLIISMRRRAPGERAEKFRTAAYKAAADPLRRQAFRWACDSIPTLQTMTPDEPAELNDRAADNWRPLLATAELCGGEWPARARKAALALSQDVDEAEGSAVVDLLQELRQLFDSRDRITSADLAEHLGKQSDKRWAEWRHSKPITQRQVARLLAPLEIKPGTIRIGSETAKGYLREWLDDAFTRYLPVSVRHTVTPQQISQVTPEINPSQNGHVTNGNNGLSSETQKDVTDVTDQNRDLWRDVV